MISVKLLLGRVVGAILFYVVGAFALTSPPLFAPWQVVLPSILVWGTCFSAGTWLILVVLGYHRRVINWINQE